MSAGTLGVTNTGGNAFILGNANPSTGAFTNNGGTLIVARPSTASQYFQDAVAIGNAANGTGRFVANSGTNIFLCGVEIGSGAGTPAISPRAQSPSMAARS